MSTPLTDTDLVEIERRFLPPQRHFDPDDPRHPLIVHTPDTIGGSPRLANSRMPVHSVMWYWNDGYQAEPQYGVVGAPPGLDAVLLAYPHLTPEQVHAAVAYAADHPDEIRWCQMRNDEVFDEHEDRERDEAIARLIAEVRRLRALVPSFRDDVTDNGDGTYTHTFTPSS